MEQILPVADRAAVAARLIDEFGSLPVLLTASFERLHCVSGSATAAIALGRFRSAMLYALRARLGDRPVLSNWQALLDYLNADMAHYVVERFRVLHLDVRNQLIRDEVSQGTIDQAAVYVREVVKRALELGSAAVILVHNHPSGDPSPSCADIEVTKAIVAAGKPLGVAVHDHLIIGVRGHVSLRATGLI